MHSRGSSIDETLKMWQKVGIGENLYINPFVDNAEYTINSFHPYEICVYNKILENVKNYALNTTLEKLKEFKKLVAQIKAEAQKETKLAQQTQKQTPETKID